MQGQQQAGGQETVGMRELFHGAEDAELVRDCVRSVVRLNRDKDARR